MPTATPAPVATPEPAGSSLGDISPAQVMEQIAESIERIGTFHFELEVAIAISLRGFETYVPLTFVGDFQAPDNMKGKAALSIGRLAVESEIIAVGGKLYATNSQTGEWEVNSDPELLVFSPLDFIGPGGSGSSVLQAVELLGEELLDEVPVIQLRGVAPPGGFDITEGEAFAEFWIGLNDLLIRKITIEGTIPLEEFAGQLGPPPSWEQPPSRQL